MRRLRGVGLIGPRPCYTRVAFSCGFCRRFSYRVEQSLVSANSPQISAISTLLLSCYIHTRQNKAREALFHSSRVNTYHLKGQTLNLPPFRASHEYSSKRDGGAGSGIIENSTLGRYGSIRLSATIRRQRLSFVIALAY